MLVIFLNLLRLENVCVFFFLQASGQRFLDTVSCEDSGYLSVLVQMPFVMKGVDVRVFRNWLVCRLLYMYKDLTVIVCNSLQTI